MEISNIYLDFILEAIRHFETKKIVYIKIVSSLSRICFTVTGSAFHCLHCMFARLVRRCICHFARSLFAGRIILLVFFLGGEPEVAPTGV